MTAKGAAYVLDNTWENELDRLRLLESVWDPGTISRLSALGVGAGWRCLELGAGAPGVPRDEDTRCTRPGGRGASKALDEIGGQCLADDAADAVRSEVLSRHGAGR